MHAQPTTNDAWLPALPAVPDRYRVHRAHAPGKAKLSAPMPLDEAERAVSYLHSIGYRARVIRERTTREIVDTTT